MARAVEGRTPGELNAAWRSARFDPRLVYRLDPPKVVVLLFASGRMVCTGARRPSDLERAVSQFDRELQHSAPNEEEPSRAVPTVPLASGVLKPRGGPVEFSP